MPKSPKTLDGVIEAYNDPAIMSRFGYNADEPKQLFYRGSVNLPGQYGFTVFACNSVIEAMLAIQDKEYYVDATYKSIPDCDYKQLLVIHLGHKDHVRYYIKLFYFILNILFFLELSGYICSYDKKDQNCVRRFV